MNKKRCIKYAIRIGVFLLVGWIGLQGFYHCCPWGSAAHFAMAMKMRCAFALKEHVDLPFNLKYPIPQIKTMEEFVKAIPLMVDEEDINSMLGFWKWEVIGWHGLHCQSYGVWMTEDVPAKLIVFTELSDAGNAYLKECVKRNIDSLHPSLREDIDVPKLCFKTTNDTWCCRIDLLKKTSESDEQELITKPKYRMAAYKKGTPLTAKPDAVVICNYTCEGSANNEYYSGVGARFGLINCNAGQLEDLGLRFYFPGPDGEVECIGAEMCDWDPEWK